MTDASTPSAEQRVSARSRIRAAAAARTSGRVSLLRAGLIAVETMAAVSVAGFVLAVPLTADLRPFLAVLLGLIVAFAILQPGSAGGLVLVLALGGGYVMVTSLGDVFGGALPPPAEVIAISVALFLVHAIDTLRASVPLGVEFDRSVLTRWLRRLAEALVPTILLGVLVLQQPAANSGGRIWVFGALAVLAAVGIPAVRMRRKPWLDRAVEQEQNR
jgi:hypothetical protein